MTAAQESQEREVVRELDVRRAPRDAREQRAQRGRAARALGRLEHDDRVRAVGEARDDEALHEVEREHGVRAAHARDRVLAAEAVARELGEQLLAPDALDVGRHLLEHYLKRVACLP